MVYLWKVQSHWLIQISGFSSIFLLSFQFVCVFQISFFFLLKNRMWKTKVVSNNTHFNRINEKKNLWFSAQFKTIVELFIDNSWLLSDYWKSRYFLSWDSDFFEFTIVFALFCGIFQKSFAMNINLNQVFSIENWIN